MQVLVENPVLTLFISMALGYALGRIKIGSFSLGVAGALFAGIAMSALNPQLALPPLVYVLGLTIFIYTTGISLGPTFFAGLRSTGMRDNLFALGIIIFGAALVATSAYLLKLDASLAAGMYTGTFTVTPALAGVLESLGKDNAAPIIGYSLAYPFSIVASLLLIGAARRLWHIDSKETSRADASINPYTVLYTRKDPVAVRDIPEKAQANVAISRVSSKGALKLATDDTIIQQGDYIAVVGTPHDYRLAVKWLGEESSSIHLEEERGHLRERRVFMSNSALAGRAIRDLPLQREYKVVITRVRRGDIDMVVRDDFVIELGDRLKIVGAHADIDSAASYLGDSYQSVAHFSVFPFAVGISLGILVGVLSLPLPGGREFSLGAAGGTIIVSLILGALRRTGPLVWQIPFSTNLSLRQLGLMIFLVGVGSTAGGSFVGALNDPKSYQLMAASFAVAIITVSAMLLIGYKFLKIPFTRLSGMVAAMNTQPATLAFANNLTKTDDANIGYASVYPLALITKIIVAQILLLALM